MTKNWKKYLPSTHFIIIIAGIAIAAGVILGIKLIVDHYKKQQFVKSTGISTDVKLSEFLGTDTDGDGVLDWEEPLWGFDPKNPDTDGNGVSDGTEVQSKKAELPGSESENSPENLNDTQKFARDLFVTINALSQNGVLNETSIANLAATLGDQVTITTVASQYSVADLSVVTTSKSTIRAYHTNLSAIINRYPQDKIGNELSIMAVMFEENNPIKIAELKAIAQNYQSFATELLAIPVPADVTEDHFTLLDSAHKISVSLGQMDAVFENPLMSLGSFISYTKESAGFISASEKLHAYFKKNGIIQ